MGVIRFAHFSDMFSGGGGRLQDHAGADRPADDRPPGSRFDPSVSGGTRGRIWDIRIDGPGTSHGRRSSSPVRRCGPIG